MTEAMPWRLPWTQENVPHANVDILRGCNISCRTCFNLLPPRAKPLEEIERDLDLLLALRKPHSVSLIGGEATLHPQLCEIVRRIRRRGIHVELVSNGVLLTESTLAALKEAGTEVIFLHIESGQVRPDLPAVASPDAVMELIREKAALVAAAGIEVGLSATVFEDCLDRLPETIRLAMDSPPLAYLLLTLYRDMGAIASVRGDVASEMRGELVHGAEATRGDRLDNHKVRDFLKRQMGLEPFAYVGSNLDGADPRWLSYMVGTVQMPGGATIASCLRASAAEKIYLAIYKWCRGTYPFYQREDPRRFRLQLALNALTGGTFFGNLSLLFRSLRRGARLGYTRIIVQNFADVLPDGRVVHCANCPDAIVRGGRLVPVCIADKIALAERPADGDADPARSDRACASS